MYTCLIAFVIFVSGIGPYISILFIATFFCIYTISEVLSLAFIGMKKLYPLILLLCLYLDVGKGPIFSTTRTVNVFLAILIHYGVKILLDKYIKAFIEYICNNEIFTLCQNCMFENVNFTTECKQCGYANCENGVPLVVKKHLRTRINTS